MKSDLDKSLLDEFSQLDEELSGHQFTTKILEYIPATNFKRQLLIRLLVITVIGFVTFPLLNGLFLGTEDTISIVIESFDFFESDLDLSFGIQVTLVFLSMVFIFWRKTRTN